MTAFGSLPLTAFASQRDCVRSWHSVSDSGYWILSLGIVLERAAQLALGMAHSPTLSASVNSSPPQEVHHVSGQLLAAVAIEWRGSIRATAEHSCSRNAATWASLLKACSRQLNAQLRQLWIWWHHCTRLYPTRRWRMHVFVGVRYAHWVALLALAHGRPRDWPDQRQLSTVQASAYCCERPLVVVLITGLDISAAHHHQRIHVHRACCCVWRQRLAYEAAIVRA